MYFQKLFPTLQDFSPSTESEDEADLRLLIQNLLNQNPSKRLTAANNALQHDFFTRRRGEVEQQFMICLNTKEVSFGIRWYRLCPEVVKKHSMTIAHYFIKIGRTLVTLHFRRPSSGFKQPEELKRP